MGPQRNERIALQGQRWRLGLVTRWIPVKNLTFSAEVMWFHLDQKFTGTSTLSIAAPKPATIYEFKDQDLVHCRSAPSAISDRRP
jgi:hypothetical protein